MSNVDATKAAQDLFRTSAPKPGQVRTPGQQSQTDWWPQMQPAQEGGQTYFWGVGSMRFNGKGTSNCPGIEYLPERTLFILRQIYNQNGEKEQYQVQGRVYKYMGLYVRNGKAPGTRKITLPESGVVTEEVVPPKMTEPGDVLIALAGCGLFAPPNGEEYPAVRGYLFHGGHFVEVRPKKGDPTKYTVGVRVTRSHPQASQADPVAAPEAEGEEIPY